MIKRLLQLPPFSHLDSGLFITLALCAFALWPLLYRPGLPNGDDVLYHVYRAAEMDRAWSNGVLIPQWAESFYTGYGAPVFHYYASLTYYITSLLSRIFGVDAVNSLRMVIALCIFGSGAGMYAFTRRFSGKAGGIIAALSYVYSPYLLFTEPYSRGAYPELLAFALFPALMWSFSRLIPNSSVGTTSMSSASLVRNFALAALLEGLLIISHNLMALVLTGLLVGWLVWSLLTAAIQKRQAIRPYFLALLAVGLGIGLAAYFWLPVVMEGSAVKLANLTGTAELNYRNFFVPSDHLFEFNPRLDGGLFNGLEHHLNLGVPQWSLGLLGAFGVGVLWTRKKLPLLRTQHSGLSTLFFALAALALIFLILPTAAPIWQAVAPLAFLQFPWRLLGPAVFCLSVLAGMNALWLERLPKLLGGTLTAGIVLLIIGLAAPTLYVPEWTHETVDTSVAAYQQAEVQGLQRATTFSNEYLPATVAVEPGVTERLLADYADGYPVNKAHIEVLPPGVTVEPLDHGPQSDLWRINAPEPFTMEVLTFAFPGWTAQIDGQPVPITPSDPHGLITFPVPAGDHTVYVSLESTPPRDLGNAVTLLSAIAIIATAVIIWQSALSLQPSALNFPASALSPQSSVLSPRYFLFGGLLTFGFLLIVMRPGGAWVESPPGTAYLSTHHINYILGDKIWVIGYDLNGDTFRPGDRVELSVYWSTTGNIPYGYSSFVHISTGGPPLVQADKLNPAGLPTKIWPSTGSIHDDYTIDLPADMPPGEYQIFVGLYTCDTRPAGECGNGDRLPVTNENQTDFGDEVPLARITVR